MGASGSLTLCCYGGNVNGGNSSTVIVLLMVVWLSTFLMVTFAYGEHVYCPSIDIRNSVAAIQRYSNCTIVEGNVQIVLLDLTASEDFINVSFTELREITQYLTVYHAGRLKSLGQLFPNLALIRGTVLVGDAALVVFSNDGLQELGLKSLTHIMEGSVKIFKNPNLCFVDSIRWDSIMELDSNNRTIYEVNVGLNKEYRECASRKKCKALGCKKEACWSSTDCQRITLDGCHPLCAGGCYKNNSQYDCFSCKGLITSDGKCVSSCPSDSLEYKTIRCISLKDCVGMKDRNNASYFTFNGSCIEQCPSRFQKSENDTTCQPCDHCIKRCKPEIRNAHNEETSDDTFRIINVSSSKKLYSCTHVNASLQIDIKTGTYYEGIEKALRHNLGMIEEISGQLKIIHSHALISLNFLPSLRVIRGDNINDTQPALIVKDNDNLVQLWDWRKKPPGPDGRRSLRLVRGKILFHFNPKLCLSEIDRLVEVAELLPYRNLEVSQVSNGYKTTCNTIDLNVTISKRESNSVILSIRHQELSGARAGTSVKYLGRSILYYRENTNNSINSNSDENVIYQSFSECGDTQWKSRDVPDDGPGMNSRTVDVILTNLEPNVQYVCFVTTYTMSSSIGTSRMFNFTTLPSQPSMPLEFSVNYTTASEAFLTWKPPYHAHGELTHYIVTASWQTDDNPDIRNRDYCKYKNDYSPSSLSTGSSRLPITVTTGSTTTTTSSTSSSTTTTTISASDIMDGLSANNNNNNDSITANNNDMIITSYDNVDETLAMGGGHAGDSLSCDCKKETKDATSNRIELCNSFEHRTDFDASIYESSGLEKCDPFIYSVMNDRYLSLTASSEFFDDFPTLIEPPAGEIVQTTFPTANMTDSKDGKYDTFVKDVPVPVTEIVLTNLRHYSEYIVSLSACRKADPDDPLLARRCSREAVLALRTARNSNADKVTHVRVIAVNQTVNISWTKPALVNSFVHSYQLEYRNADSNYSKFVEQCITDRDFRRPNFSYVLENVPSGHYLVRVKAISLAGDGAYAEVKFRIEEQTLGYGTVVVSSLFVIVVICAVLIGLLYYWRARIIGKKDEFATLIASVNPRYEPVYLGDQWEVARENVTLIRQLGRGIFGSVHEAVLQPNDIRCAVKTTSSDSESNYKLSKEASLMKEFHSAYHIVRLLGVVSKEKPVYVIMELMERGDLKTYLLNSAPTFCDRHGVPSFRAVIKMAAQVADGMAFLESKKYVHRDLAARNCMVAADGMVKIGDFGLARDIYETDYYRKGDRGTLPIRWMAPESIRDGVFTSHSDVWSYGVVLWEIFTLAQMPYHPRTNEEVIRYVQSGGLLEVPFYCDPLVKNIMRSCWRWHASQRPKFVHILRILDPYLNDDFRQVSYYHNGESPDKPDNVLPCFQNLKDYVLYSDDTVIQLPSIINADPAKTIIGGGITKIDEVDEDEQEEDALANNEESSFESEFESDDEQTKRRSVQLSFTTDRDSPNRAKYYNYVGTSKSNGYINTFG